MKNKRRNNNKRSRKGGSRRKGKPAPQVNGKALVRGIQANLEKEGLVKDASGFEKLIIHDHTNHRIITDANKSVKHFNEHGNIVKLEVYVPKMTVATCNVMRVALRSLGRTLSADMIVDMFCKNDHWIINPQEVVDTLIGLMQDGIIDRNIVDRVLDIEHPVWSQLRWEEDTDLETDFVSHWMNHPNFSDNREDALKALSEDKPNYLARKEGKVSVVIKDINGKDQMYHFDLSIEKAELDNQAGRKRYFLADARLGSPFRSQYLNMVGWKKADVIVRGKPTSLKQIPLRRPDFLHKEITEGKLVVKMGDFAEAELEPGQSLLDYLLAGNTVTNY